jgi:hypothetical protein
MLVEHEPQQVMDLPTDPPVRYRPKVKLGPVHQGRPERHIYEEDGSPPTS